MQLRSTNSYTRKVEAAESTNKLQAEIDHLKGTKKIPELVLNTFAVNVSLLAVATMLEGMLSSANEFNVSTTLHPQPIEAYPEKKHHKGVQMAGQHETLARGSRFFL